MNKQLNREKDWEKECGQSKRVKKEKREGQQKRDRERKC